MYKRTIYINPLTDFGFKLIFGNPANKAFLISFLNALFEGEPEIVEIRYDDKELLGCSAEERAMIFDIHCTTSTGEHIIVEMQNRYQARFRDRALYYVAGDLHRQGEKGEDWDYSLTPVYGIFLMNFDWKEFENNPIREDVALISMQTGELFSDRMKMIFLKVPLMEKSPSDCQSDLDMWMYVLKNLDKMDKMPQEFMTKEIFRKLEHTARLGALTPEQRRDYEHSLKVYRDNYAIAKTQRDLGRAEGEAKGRAEVEVSMVRSMRDNGLDIPLISRVSGLTPEQVSRILQN